VAGGRAEAAALVARAGIAATRRGETLGLDEFMAIARAQLWLCTLLCVLLYSASQYSWLKKRAT